MVGRNPRPANERADRRVVISKKTAGTQGPAADGENVQTTFTATDKGEVISATESSRQPRGLLRLLFRLPVWFYRLRLGWLFGERFLLIHHVGRKTGRHYRTVVEIARHDPTVGLYVVASGYGPRADWYRNLRHTPDVTIQVGRRRLNARAELLSPEESGEEMVDYARRHPLAARTLTKMIGYQVDGSEAGYRQLGRSRIPFVALHTRERVARRHDYLHPAV